MFRFFEYQDRIPVEVHLPRIPGAEWPLLIVAIIVCLAGVAWFWVGIFNGFSDVLKRRAPPVTCSGNANRKRERKMESAEIVAALLATIGTVAAIAFLIWWTYLQL